MKCNNCNQEIIGAVCSDNSDNPICFSCWLWSKDASRENISCPKCYGVGKLTNYGYNKDVDGLLPCGVCDGSGQIKRADVGDPLPTETIADEMVCPF